MVDKLFVYGTLRLGERNEFADELAAVARHIGMAKVNGRLFKVSHYPALVLGNSDDELVTGDVFEAVSEDLLQRLDDYEGDEYARKIVDVKMDDGRVLAAYVYCYALPTDRMHRIETGDWIRFFKGTDAKDRP